MFVGFKRDEQLWKLKDLIKQKQEAVGSDK